MVNVVAAGQTANPGFGILLHDLDSNYLIPSSGQSTGAASAGHAGGHGSGGASAGEVPAHLVNGKFGTDAANTFEFLKGTCALEL